MIKERMTKLNLFVNTRYLQDIIVNPSISEWFGYIDANGVEVPMLQ